MFGISNKTLIIVLVVIAVVYFYMKNNKPVVKAKEVKNISVD